MDPLAVFGLAANIIQFIDFGSRVLKAYKKEFSQTASLVNELIYQLEQHKQENPLKTPLEIICIALGFDLLLYLQQQLVQCRQRLFFLCQILLYLLRSVWFAEFPDGIRHLCTTMPWTIWPALVVLWGVCWMFYNPLSSEDVVNLQSTLLETHDTFESFGQLAVYWFSLDPIQEAFSNISRTDIFSHDYDDALNLDFSPLEDMIESNNLMTSKDLLAAVHDKSQWEIPPSQQEQDRSPSQRAYENPLSPTIIVHNVISNDGPSTGRSIYPCTHQDCRDHPGFLRQCDLK
jgi:hypothetical protein